MPSETALLLEQAILFKVCKDNTKDIDEAVSDFNCIQDMLSIQKMQSIVLNFGKTKNGKIRKGSSFWEMLVGRLEVHANATK